MSRDGNLWIGWFPSNINGLRVLFVSSLFIFELWKIKKYFLKNGQKNILEDKWQSEKKLFKTVEKSIKNYWKNQSKHNEKIN